MGEMCQRGWKKFSSIHLHAREWERAADVEEDGERERWRGSKGERCDENSGRERAYAGWRFSIARERKRQGRERERRVRHGAKWRWHNAMEKKVEKRRGMCIRRRMSISHDENLI